MTVATIYGATTDGYLKKACETPTYAPARDATSADSATAGDTDLWVGWSYKILNLVSMDWENILYRAFLYFDTSSIPAAAEIAAATLSVYLYWEDSPPTGHDIILYSGDAYGVPSSPLATSDFSRQFYSSGGASNITVWGGSSGLLTFTLNATGYGWITKGGTTKLCLRSEFDVTPTIPGADMLAKFYSTEKGGGYRPVLTVTYGTKPTVTTDAATSEGPSYAVGNGTITDDGSDAITAYGAIWNDDGTDPLDLAHADNYAEGVDLAGDQFSADMGGLNASTDYLYRAYATSASGTGYGDAVEFTTTAALSAFTVTTQEASSIVDTSMTLHGRIVEDAGETIPQHGFVWKKNSDPYEEAAPINHPTGADGYVLLGTGAEGAFTTGIAGLDTGSVYLYRAFATYGGTQKVLRPSGEGDETNIYAPIEEEGRPHWLEVLAEADAKKVWTYNTGSFERDLYEIDDTTLTGTISKVSVFCLCRGTVVTGSIAKAALKAGATVSEGPETMLDPAATYILVTGSWDTNPDTLAAWTPSDIADLQIGVALKGVTKTFEYAASCDYVYCTVDYSPPTGAILTEYGGLRIARTAPAETTSDYTGMAWDGSLYLEDAGYTGSDEIRAALTTATTADSVATAATTITLKKSEEDVGGEWEGLLRRAALYFDTSAIAANATILSATLYIFVTDQSSATAPQRYAGPINVYDGQPTRPTSSGTTPGLVVGDYNVANYSDIADIATNWAGYGAGTGSCSIPTGSITRAGLTKFLVDDSYWDRVGSWSSYITIATGDHATNKPVLEVTYAVPGSPPPLPQINVSGTMKDGKNALLRVGNQWRLVTKVMVNPTGSALTGAA